MILFLPNLRGISLLCGGQNEQRLRAADARNALDLVQEPFERAGRIRADLDQIVVISRNIVAFDDRTALFRKIDEAFVEARMIHQNADERRDVQTGFLFIKDRRVLLDGTGVFELPDSLDDCRYGKIDLFT